MSQSEKITIRRHGGCEGSVTLRQSKVREADYYLCHSRQDGVQCEKTLPAPHAGKIRVVEMKVAGSFWGYRDEWPDAKRLHRSIAPAKFLHAD